MGGHQVGWKWIAADGRDTYTPLALFLINCTTPARTRNSARIALRNFKRVQEIMSEVKGLDAEIAASKGPLNVGPHTHNALLSVFSQALSVVRHILLTGILSEGEQAEAQAVVPTAPITGRGVPHRSKVHPTFYVFARCTPHVCKTQVR